jgi:hypothetical protein
MCVGRRFHQGGNLNLPAGRLPKLGTAPTSSCQSTAYPGCRIHARGARAGPGPIGRDRKFDCLRP